MRIPFFNISAALVENNKPLVSAIYSPITEELFYAERNEGAFLNGKRIKVNDIEKLERSRLFYCVNRKYLDEFLHVFVKLRKKVLSLDRLRSAEIETAMVACGRVEAFFYIGAKIWDVVSGALIVKEARGKVTDFEGKEWNTTSKDFLASNGKIHKEIIEVVNQ